MKIKTGIRYLPAVSALLCLATTANAGVVTIGGNVLGTPETAIAIAAFATSGASMAVPVGAMTVSVNGGLASNWVTGVGACTLAADCGQATGSVGNGTWTLTVTGITGHVGNTATPTSTSDIVWTLTSTSTTTAITSLLLDGGGNGTPGNTVFDRDPLNNGAVGTPGSAFGVDASFGGTESGPNMPVGGYPVGVTYSNIVRLALPELGCGATAPFSGNTSAAGCQDEWQTVTFSFTAGQFVGGAGGNAIWSFHLDSDTLGTPEPMTMGLMGAGLLAIVAYRKRRFAGLPK